MGSAASRTAPSGEAPGPQPADPIAFFEYAVALGVRFTVLYRQLLTTAPPNDRNNNAGLAAELPRHLDEWIRLYDIRAAQAALDMLERQHQRDDPPLAAAASEFGRLLFERIGHAVSGLAGPQLRLEVIDCLDRNMGKVNADVLHSAAIYHRAIRQPPPTPEAAPPPPQWTSSYAIQRPAPPAQQTVQAPPQCPQVLCSIGGANQQGVVGDVREQQAIRLAILQHFQSSEC